MKVAMGGCQPDTTSYKGGGEHTINIPFQLPVER